MPKWEPTGSDASSDDESQSDDEMLDVSSQPSLGVHRCHVRESSTLRLSRNMTICARSFETRTVPRQLVELPWVPGSLPCICQQPVPSRPPTSATRTEPSSRPTQSATKRPSQSIVKQEASGNGGGLSSRPKTTQPSTKSETTSRGSTSRQRM